MYTMSGTTPDYTGVYNPEAPSHHHVDVEVDASFDIKVYDKDGNYETITPENVQVEKVYATVYNTAALIDIEGYDESKRKWNEELFQILLQYRMILHLTETLFLVLENHISLII